MKFLPGNFPAEDMSAVEVRKLEYFYENFVIGKYEVYGMGHFVLACYAALPAVLTPDLLNKLWLNFKNYTLDGQPVTIHPVAAADILLSPLVEEIGFELYEMSEQIRKAFLRYTKEVTADAAKNTWGFFMLDQVAEFLRDYVVYDFTPENPDDNAFREAQEWTAISYLNPGRAFAEVVQAFDRTTSNSGKARYRDAIEKMSARFAFNIVKDNSNIPEGAKAMTALTSVIRDVIHKREPAKLEELKQEALNNKNLLTEKPILQQNIINIEVPETVTSIMEDDGKKENNQPPVLRALVIGIPHATAAGYGSNSVDVNSADLIESELNNFFSTPGLLDIFTVDSCSKENILKTLLNLVIGCSINDDILFYLAANAKAADGHCFVACEDSGDFEKDRQSWLMDDEIASLAKTAKCRSFTAIIQTDHAATNYWLDISNPKNIIFASCKNDQRPDVSTYTAEKVTYCTFTYCLAEAIRNNKGTLSNRLLCMLAIDLYGKYEKPEIRMLKTPQLLCHPDALNRFFLQGKNHTVELQNLLRQTGYCDEMTTGKWNKDTQFALNAFCDDKHVSKDLSKQEYIELLLAEKEKKENGHVPVFLLIFSDPKKSLPAIAEERKVLLETLNPRVKNSQIELLVLDDPSIIEIKQTFSDKKIRNRVELFYCSGKDDNGYLELKDGTLNLQDITGLLRYQENIKLFFANTCRSMMPAEYLTQLGVKNAFGVSGQVADAVAAAFGKSLFKLIVEGKDIENNSSLPFLQPNSTDISEGSYVLFKAGWLTDEAIIKWEFKDQIENETGLYAMVIAIDHYTTLTNVPGVKVQALQFNEWISQHSHEESHGLLISSDINSFTQNDIDTRIEQVVSVARLSKDKARTLIVYMNGQGIRDNSGPVLYLPDVSAQYRNSGLNIKSYITGLRQLDLFDNIILFFDLFDAEGSPVAGLNPLFGNELTPSLNATSLLMGNVPVEKTNIDSRLQWAGHGEFTKKILEGLNDKAIDINGNITARSLTDFMHGAMPYIYADLSGSADAILMSTGKQEHFQKVILRFPQQYLNKQLHLLHSSQSEIDSVEILQPELEYELKPGSYIAQVPETGLQKYFDVVISGEPIIIDMSWIFLKKWIWIIGTAYDLSKPEENTAKTIGKFLAEKGYGLITGGWPGVDQLVGEAYVDTIDKYLDKTGDDHFIQVIQQKQAQTFKKGKTEVVSKKEWQDHVRAKSAAIISIGGKGGTYEIFKYARETGFPFIPIPQTGADSRTAYDMLLDSPHPQIPKEYLEELNNFSSVNDNGYFNVLQKILDNIIADTKNNAEGLFDLIYPWERLLQGWQEESSLFMGLRAAVKKFKIVCIVRPMNNNKSFFIDKGLNDFLQEFSASSKLIRIEAGARAYTTYSGIFESLSKHRNSVLLIDKYENLADKEVNEKEKQLFEDAVLKASSTNKVIILLKQGYEDSFKDSPLIGTYRRRNTMEITGMTNPESYLFVMPSLTKDEIREIVMQPVKKAGVFYSSLQKNEKADNAFVQKIIDDAFLIPYPATYLAAALLELYTKREGKALLESVYNELGGIAGMQQQLEPVDFKTLVERTYRSKKIEVADDLQKNRWGGKAELNGRVMKATVKEAGTNNYKITVSIESPERPKSNRRQQVAFFLHNTFNNQIEYADMINGEVELEVEAYEAFTIGAYLEYGTQLELDLNEVKGFPPGFYYKDVSPLFKSTVEQLFASKQILVKDDLQKRRWGGNNVAGGLKLSATVKESILGLYTIKLDLTRISNATAETLRSNENNPMRKISLSVGVGKKEEIYERKEIGDVAFFVHDTFSNVIIYKKTTDENVTITLAAYGAFTVGAYAQNGSMLELDLNEVKGFPEGFYYKD